MNVKWNNKRQFSTTNSMTVQVFRPEHGVEVQKGLASSLQQKLGFTQMLRVLRVDTSNAYMSVSIFAQQSPFLRYGHIYKKL